MEKTWQTLAQGYGRDYSWLAGALALYEGSVLQAQDAAAVHFVPDARQDITADFGWQYGLAPGCRLHFLLEDVAAPPPAAVWGQLLPALPDDRDWYCIPVKAGRPALGWQLGLRLGAVRPLALLRPFYLFCLPGQLAAAGEVRRVPLADTRRLGKLLDSGWAGVDLCPLAGEILLQKRINTAPCL